MAKNMGSVEQETIARSTRIVNEKVQMLIKVWKTFYDDICCMDYMTSLPASIGMFLDEVFHITMHHCARKNKEIQELNVEVTKLERTLGAAAPRDDWEYQEMSLDRRSMLLQQKVFELRSKLRSRFNQYVEEQNQLCDELGNRNKIFAPKSKVAELPNEAMMIFLSDYLVRLRKEKGSRLERIAQLQADLRTVAKLLDWEPRKPEQKLLLNERNLPPTEQTVTDLEILYSVVNRLLKGKMILQAQPTELTAPLPDNLSPPPPPPSPEGELAVAQSSAGTQQSTIVAPVPSSSGSSTSSSCSNTPQSALFDGVRPKDGLLEVNIRRYQQLLADACSPDVTRERIIEDIFRGMHGNINLWWDRCLVSYDERKRSKVLQFTKLDEEAMVAHVEQQEQLKTFYYDNETLFQLIYQWSEWWSACLKIERNAPPYVAVSSIAASHGLVGSKMKNKIPLSASDRHQLRQVKDQLATIEMRLKEQCDAFEQRNQSKFTLFGVPAMSMLSTLKKKRKELTMPSSCKVRPARVINRKSLRLGQTNQMLFNVALPKQYAPALGSTVCDATPLGENHSVCHTTTTTTIGGITSANDDPNGPDRTVVLSDSSADCSDSSSSSDGHEEDDARDDQLLEEAFASASASTAIKKPTVGSENGARPKATGGQGWLTVSSITNDPPPATNAGKALPVAVTMVVKEAPKKREIRAQLEDSLV